MVVYGFNGVLRAGGVVAAVTGHQRTDCILVEADGQKQKLAH
jgi:hypothetical protein